LRPFGQFPGRYKRVRLTIGKAVDRLAHQSFPGGLRSRRIVLIGVACVVVYAVVFFVLKRDTSDHEETFTSAPTATAGITLYVDEVAFDPVRQAIDVRFDLASSSTLRGARYGALVNRDLELSIDDGDSEQVVAVHRSDAGSSHLVSLDMHGAIAAYPFDRYRGEIRISARDLYVRARPRPVSIRATVWEGLAGWVSSIRALPAAQANSTLAIALTVRRPLPVVAFAAIVYALMLIIAVCSLCIGSLVFTGARKVESTIVGALVTMVFSIAVLRNVVPGTPPIGVTADLVIFLWAEIAVIAGLCLLVTAWVKRGPGV
jgi:hypothetical protein